MKKLLEELFSCINGDKATHEFMETEILKLAKDAERYRWLKSERGFNEAGIFIARQDAAGIVRWNYEAADQLIDAHMRPLIDGVKESK